MNDDFVTPLELLPANSGGAGTSPKVFLKREDLLPYGGGNKVRRLLAWADDLEDGDTRAIAVLSYCGSHTFLALAELLHHGLLPGRKLVFWESNRLATAYTETIRQRYCDAHGVTVIGGSTAGLLVRMAWSKCFSRRSTLVLPIGGSIAPRRPPYRKPLDQCEAQLAAAGHAGRVWHLLPASSGTMLDGLAQSIADADYQNHRLIGLLTGPRIARRVVAARCRKNKRILLIPTRPLGWDEYLPLATAFYEQTDIWVDPMHMVHSIQTLGRLPAEVHPEDAVVCWITSPRVGKLVSSDRNP